MNSKPLIAIGSICLLLIGAAQAYAFQIAPLPMTVEFQGDARTAAQALRDLELQVADLEREFITPPANAPTTQPSAPVRETPQPIIFTDIKNQPVSMQYRTITTIVHFELTRVACDDGPEMCYTQGSFLDSTDGKTYRFLFNDMGAIASTRGDKMECVVVFRPSDRQLNESDIAALVPTQWVKDNSRETKP